MYGSLYGLVFRPFDRNYPANKYYTLLTTLLVIMVATTAILGILTLVIGSVARRTDECKKRFVDVLKASCRELARFLKEQKGIDRIKFCSFLQLPKRNRLEIFVHVGNWTDEQVEKILKAKYMCYEMPSGYAWKTNKIVYYNFEHPDSYLFGLSDELSQKTTGVANIISIPIAIDIDQDLTYSSEDPVVGVLNFVTMQGTPPEFNIAPIINEERNNSTLPNNDGPIQQKLNGLAQSIFDELRKQRIIKKEVSGDVDADEDE